jgi:deoxyribodipyrimidine photo-lyase
VRHCQSVQDLERPIIHWFRRDLRTTDNLALSRAAEPGASIIPAYILSEWHQSHSWTGPNRQQFICDSLAALSKQLATIDGRLILRRGDPVTALRLLALESHASAIHCNAAPDPFGKSVETAVAEMCSEIGIACHVHDDVALHGASAVLTQTGQPYRVFTPYYRNWLALPKPTPLASPQRLRTPPSLKSLGLPQLKDWGLPPSQIPPLEASEPAARKRLRQALSGPVPNYAEHRDFPAKNGTSRLSQDLRHGLISVRTVHAACLKAQAEATPAHSPSFDTLIKELAWREFYFAILHHFPNVLDEEFNPEWRGLPWDEPGDRFEAWKLGKTGFPIVDAGMRELLATGFMHNRLRMITAMFLTKDLHIDWKLGESWFMQQLVDGDIAANNGGWQWSAGTGADAAPYFRIQNPWSQTARYDPAGNYIKRWVPELAQVAPQRFLQPPADGRPLAPGYPLPCVDHKTERERTLAIFKHHRSQKR